MVEQRDEGGIVSPPGARGRSCGRRGFLDDAWRRSLDQLLRGLGRLAGPVRDLDVLVERVRGEVHNLGEEERSDDVALLARLEAEQEGPRERLPRAWKRLRKSA